MTDAVSRRGSAAGGTITIGLLRLTDSAPAIVAHEFGFFADEGLDVALSVEPSWANVADKLAYGPLDAAGRRSPSPRRSACAGPPNL